MAGKAYKTLAEARRAAGKGKIIKLKYDFDHTTGDGQKRLMAISRGLDSETYIAKRLPPLKAGQDYGADPLGDGTFKMVPSGDIVDFEERNMRLARKNPPRTKIYNRVIKIYASKAGMPHNCDAECKKHGHNYVHHFKEKACIYGLPDGTLWVK
jgi:hypothetical protein